MKSGFSFGSRAHVDTWDIVWTWSDSGHLRAKVLQPCSPNSFKKDTEMARGILKRDEKNNFPCCFRETGDIILQKCFGSFNVET